MEDKKEEVRLLLSQYQTDVTSFIIFCGDLDNIQKAFVVIKDDCYEYNDPLLAIQAIFERRVALRSWPCLTDYVWTFLQLMVFKIPLKTEGFCVRNCTKLTEFMNLVNNYTLPTS